MSETVMISVREALRIVLENAPAPTVVEIPSVEAGGRVLAEELLASEDIPAFDRSAMDGYAVCAEDTLGASAASPRSAEVVDAIPAGRGESREIVPGTAAEIMTGAPIPPGADAVVEQEATVRESSAVRIRREVRSGDNVRRAGDEAKQGQAVLARGARLSPAAVGLLATLGRRTVSVYRPPRAAVLATGSELVGPEETPPAGGIRDSNGWMLAAALAEADARPEQVLRASDDPDVLRDRLKALLDADPEIVLLTGGVSVGKWDFVRDLLQEFDFRALFWKVAQKPGKPLFAARRGRTLALGLPGNPASALVCFYEYAWPAVRKAQGWAAPRLEEVSARLAGPVRHSPGKTDFLRGRLEYAPDGGFLATPEKNQGSHLLGPFARADALIVIEQESGDLPAGTMVRVHRLPGGWDHRALPPVSGK